MAYDEDLAARIREVLGARRSFDEIAMFGGLCFTVRGNMVVGVTRDDLMVRVGPDAHEELAAKPGARPMDFTKRPMKGFLFVDQRGVGTKRDLTAWVERSLAYTDTLPAKSPKKRTTRGGTKAPAKRRSR